MFRAYSKRNRAERNDDGEILRHWEAMQTTHGALFGFHFVISRIIPRHSDRIYTDSDKRLTLIFIKIFDKIYIESKGNPKLSSLFISKGEKT